MAFIPIYDGTPLRRIRHPYVSWGLIAANVIVYFVFEGGGFTGEADQASAISFGLIPAVLNHIVALPHEYAEIPGPLTLLTYSFLHGDIWHLAGNMLFLWVFADNVEDGLGHVRFFLFYVLCAIGSGYVYVLSDPASEAPVIGASGAIAGIIAGYFMLHPYAKIWVLLLARIPLHLNAWWVLGFWIAFQVYEVLYGGGDQVAWWSHVGGLLVGALLILILRPRGVPLFRREEELAPPVAKVDAAEVPRYRPPPPGPWNP